MYIKIKEKGTITVELWENVAPIAIQNVKKVASLGKYNNRRIERLEPDFVIQPLFFDGYDEVIDEVIAPEFKNPENAAIPFERYTVAMAGDADIASGSEYFITLKPKERLNGNFTIIGKVVSGFEVVEDIEKQKVIEEKDENGYVYHYPEKDIIVEEVIVK